MHGEVQYPFFDQDLHLFEETRYTILFEPQEDAVFREQTESLKNFFFYKFLLPRNSPYLYPLFVYFSWLVIRYTILDSRTTVLINFCCCARFFKLLFHGLCFFFLHIFFHSLWCPFNKLFRFLKTK